MKFLELVEKLQKENEGYVVLVRCGIFLDCIGKDAVFMKEHVGLNTICAKEGLCKTGIYISTIKDMIPKLKATGYSYKIFDYLKDKRTVKEICRIDGKLMEETRICFDCEKCTRKNNTMKDAIKYFNDLQSGKIVL